VFSITFWKQSIGNWLVIQTHSAAFSWSFHEAPVRPVSLTMSMDLSWNSHELLGQSTYDNPTSNISE